LTEKAKEAVKNDGVYRLTALSNANEAERSADGVIALFMDSEMKRNGLTKLSCLKHRDGDDFLPFEATIDFTGHFPDSYLKGGGHRSYKA